MKKQTTIFTLIFMMLFSAFTYATSNEEAELIRHYIWGNYVEPMDYEEIHGETPDAIFEGLDSYSQYFTQEELSRFMEDLRGEFAGIGVYITERMEKIIVSEPVQGSPAQKAGILSEDEIVSVNGEDITGRSLDEVSSLIKGPEGTEVAVGIKRLGYEEPLIFNITRAFITINPVTHQVMEDIGYIEIKNFNEHATEYAIKALMEFQQQGLHKLIIDLRNNPGGSLNEVIELSRVLLPRGPIVHIQYRDNQVTYSSFLPKPFFSDMVVLVNEASASAAEIFAAAAKESGAATIIGKTTFGKGSVQRIYTLPTGAGFRLTEARYLSPLENEIDNVGVAPHFEVERFSSDIRMVDFLPVQIERKPTLGDEGSDVTAAQQRLKAMGYDIQESKGILGNSTFEAIYQFQSDAGLYPYGVLDFTTQRTINDLFIQWINGPDQDQQLRAAVAYLTYGDLASIVEFK